MAATVTIPTDVLEELIQTISAFKSQTTNLINQHLHPLFLQRTDELQNASSVILKKVAKLLPPDGTKFTLFSLLPPELRHKIWVCIIKAQVVVPLKWISQVLGHLADVGIDIRTTLRHVNREARGEFLSSRWIEFYQPPLSNTTPPPHIRLDKQIPFFIDVPINAGLYHMLKMNFVPGVYCQEEVTSEQYLGLPILRKNRDVPCIAFEFCTWARLIGGENDTFHPMGGNMVEATMGVLAALQFLGVKEVIIVVEHVRFERPNLSVEVWANKSGLFRGLFYDFCDAISNAPKTWDHLEDIMAEFFTQLHGRRVVERDRKLAALNMSLQQFQTDQQYFMWSRCEGWQCPKFTFREAVSDA